MKLSQEIISVLTCLCLIKIVSGFTCYKCAYSLNTEGSRRECIEDPDSLGSNAILECNSTSYCVLQEQYDIHKDIVTSYFRTCSGVTWGFNSCDRDWSHVTCKHSCQGDFCNNGDRGERFKTYLENHKDQQGYSSAGHMDLNIIVMTLCPLAFIVAVMR